MSMAQQAAMAAVTPSVHIDRVVHSVTDATKRLSQISSSTTNTTTQSSKRRSRDTIGPWKLGKTLGKGSSGRVRLAKNVETGKLAAVKIVPKARSSRQGASSPYGIEREIIIMKLISHPNVMGLYEVWENKFELFLVLEYVDGGELFDYLVSRGRLPEKEAIHYFRQIVEGTAYCHGFNICHRDLKPENLLLDKKNKRIKIADFGMAALQPSNKLLETSCGSPHYASPEIVIGKSYDGGPSDVWSCGIILFALLTGHLPFNDDNIKRLLLKVQSGKFQMPQGISSEAKDLLSRILVVDPAKRLTINEILFHPLLAKYSNKRSKSNSDLHVLERSLPCAVILDSEKDVDPTILQNLQILWHSAPKPLILKRLMDPNPNEEKTFYALLLAYQQRQSKQQHKHPTISAPKILQKSQFSVPSIKSQTSPRKEHVASSSRVFKSSSKKKLQTSASKRSLHHSASKKSLVSVSVSASASRKSLKSSPVKTPAPPLPSKQSLYSLNSISKRSVNLKEHLNHNDVPPLPIQSEFETLCEEILFGSGIDETVQEEETNATSTITRTNSTEVDASRELTQADTPKKVEREKSPSQDEQRPEKKASPSMTRLKTTPSSRNLRITSAPSGQQANGFSLDPRRNVSQPNSIEMLLNKYSLRAHLKSKSNLKTLRNSGNWQHAELGLLEASKPIELTDLEIEHTRSSNRSQPGDTSVFSAQSSTSRRERKEDRMFDNTYQAQTQASVTKNSAMSPSISINSSVTLKNLKQFLPENENSAERAPSVVHHPMRYSVKTVKAGISARPPCKSCAPATNIAGQGVSRKVSKASNFDGPSDLLSDMSFALDIPLDTFTAQAFHISRDCLPEQNQNGRRPVLRKEDPVEDDINIFEDAPCDTASVATSSSGLDSQPHVHRKATSIDTLNAASVLAPNADVRVSMYTNNMPSSAKLPRETTEEIISKFKLSPQKGEVAPQKRLSYQRARNSISQSVMSMFKDLDGENDGEFDKQNFADFDGIRNLNELPRDASGSLNDAVLEKESATKKRVTMLFDDEAGNVFKSSPSRPLRNEHFAAEPVHKLPSSSGAPVTFGNNKLDPVTENETPNSPRKVEQCLRPAPPPPVKQTWFKKLFRSFTSKSSKEELIRDHSTVLEFEEVLIVMLKEFANNSIDYTLKRLDKSKNTRRAEYSCWFQKGRFRFKIRIDGKEVGTNIHIKKKGQQDQITFEKFNNDISKVLQSAEQK
ncbi:LAME_0G16534g1_1 [Lachancea meyersii CBS 8951]|uniref:non-specific serine/threonine protein kinase n=1 Tax=Lachancea meyersii CBS 8951 TaxID=1266667 RepID=A0A1G4KB39_9SACH|nr:LAME_0G16534g1_1 [Lachancea meyersii CBS 8951]